MKERNIDISAHGVASGKLAFVPTAEIVGPFSRLPSISRPGHKDRKGAGEQVAEKISKQYFPEVTNKNLFSPRWNSRARNSPDAGISIVRQ